MAICCGRSTSGSDSRSKRPTGTAPSAWKKGNAVKRGVPQAASSARCGETFYMNRFLKHWRGSGREKAIRVRVVSSADDFVILSRGRVAEAYAVIEMGFDDFVRGTSRG